MHSHVNGIGVSKRSSIFETSSLDPNVHHVLDYMLENGLATINTKYTGNYFLQRYQKLFV